MNNCHPLSSTNSGDHEITPHDLQKLLEADKSVVMIDVRESDERAVSNIGGLHIPLGDFEARIGEIPSNTTVVIYCRSGGRSGKACDKLRGTRATQKILNLAGGMKRWATDIDPSMPVA